MIDTKTVTETVNATTITWDVNEPLRWSASTKSAETAPQYNDKFDLTELRAAFEERLLLSLKDLLITRYRRVKRRKAREDAESMTRLLRRIQSKQITLNERLMDQSKINVIDGGLMAAIRAKLVEQPDWIPANDLRTLKTLFLYGGEGSVFVGLSAGDFPLAGTGRSPEELFRTRILAQALTRSAQIAVLKNIEDGFQNLEIDLALYTFWNLAHHLFIRPESYRQITCGDLIVAVDKATKRKTYVLMIMPAKRHNIVPKPMPTEIDEQMGELLLLQRQSVIRQNSPLYGIEPSLPINERKELECRLALFPRRSGTPKPFEVANFGVLENHQDVRSSYVLPLQRRLDSVKIGFNVMRHTIATHLAAAGCSAQIIQAVLKHATDYTARVYVDLATKELKERLSKGLEGLAPFPSISGIYDSARRQSVSDKNDQQHQC